MMLQPKFDPVMMIAPCHQGIGVDPCQKQIKGELRHWPRRVILVLAGSGCEGKGDLQIMFELWYSRKRGQGLRTRHLVWMESSEVTAMHVQPYGIALQSDLQSHKAQTSRF